MSQPGTWCDNIIMYAVANAFNCVINITQSNINLPNRQKVIFIRNINEWHYVSTVTNTNNQNIN